MDQKTPWRNQQSAVYSARLLEPGQPKLDRVFFTVISPYMVWAADESVE